MYAFDTGSGTEVGDRVSLQNYFDETDTDTWLSATIPFGDMGLGTTDFDAIRMQMTTTDGKNSPTFYIDNFQAEETGDPAIFSYSPSGNQVQYLVGMKILVADQVTQTSEYNKILGLNELSGGVNFSIQSQGQIGIQQSFRKLIDMLNFPTSNLYQEAGNPTSFFTVYYDLRDFDIALNPLESDYIRAVLTEDLSGLEYFRVYVLLESRNT